LRTCPPFSSRSIPHFKGDSFPRWIVIEAAIIIGQSLEKEFSIFSSANTSLDTGKLCMSQSAYYLSGPSAPSLSPQQASRKGLLGGYSELVGLKQAQILF
jgi:hypothetical protein